MITFLVWAYMVLFKYTILMRLFQLSLPKNVYKIKQKKRFRRLEVVCCQSSGIRFRIRYSKLHWMKF
jgi:hypothetical protein